jgi:glucuronoarabinoxylan endo-1,4-beta-xylanase
VGTLTTSSANGGSTTKPSGGSPGLDANTSANGGMTSPSDGGHQATGGVVGTGGTTSSGGKTGDGGNATSTGGRQAGGSTGTVTGLAAGGGSIATGGASGGSVGMDGGTGVTVELARPKQTIEGFGISDIWASQPLPSTLFGTTGDGLGLSILRVGMDADGTLLGSPAASDLADAKGRGLKIIGTCYSAPASCKTNGKMGSGGHLKPECYESWATTIAGFAEKYGLSAMSVQSEPDFTLCYPQMCSGSDAPATLFSADEMVTFVKVVGPKLRALNPPVKVIAPETSDWGHLWTNDSAPDAGDPLEGKYDYGHALAKDTTAWAQVDIVGTHQYFSQLARPWPADVSQPKPVWMTEMSGIKGWPEQGPSSDIANGVAVAGWIHDALVNGMASAWIWWWYKLSEGNVNDNEGLLLQDGKATKRYFTLGNFSRFIRPGYARVDLGGSIPADVMLSAYQGSDGTLVVVAINKSKSPITVPIAFAGGPAPASLVPWVTSSTDNLKSGATVALSEGKFAAELGAMTVTTFVGK